MTDSKIKMFQAGIWLYPELTSQMLCMKDSQQILKESQPWHSHLKYTEIDSVPLTRGLKGICLTKNMYSVFISQSRVSFNSKMFNTCIYQIEFLKHVQNIKKTKILKLVYNATFNSFSLKVETCY